MARVLPRTSGGSTAAAQIMRASVRTPQQPSRTFGAAERNQTRPTQPAGRRRGSGPRRSGRRTVGNTADLPAYGLTPSGRQRPPAAGERWRLAACLLLGPGVCERTWVAHVVPGVRDPAVGALGAAHGARRRASLGPFCLWRANASGRPGGRLRSCEANFRAAIAPAVAAVAYRGSFGVTVFGPERYRGVRSPPAN